MADQAVVFYKRLASLLSEKRNEHYAIVMGWIIIIVLGRQHQLIVARGRGLSQTMTIMDYN